MKSHDLVFKQLFWQRPFDFNQVLELTSNIATHYPRDLIIFEIRGRKNKISYYLGTSKSNYPKLERLFKTHNEINFSSELKQSERRNARIAKKLVLSSAVQSLKVDDNEALARSVLSSMAQLTSEDELVLQIVIGSSSIPQSIPRTIQSPNASIIEVISNKVPLASSEVRLSIKDKITSYRLNCTIRIGSISDSDYRARSNIFSLVSALKGLESSGTKFKVIGDTPLNVQVARQSWRMQKLSVKELSNLLALPTGDCDYLGVDKLHPRILLPPKQMEVPAKNIRAFGETVNQNKQDRKLLTLSPTDNLTNLFIVGPTGSGKSVLMENLILGDLASQEKRGAIVIDPKFSLISSIVEKIPESRLDDVVIWDVVSSRPIGINPFSQLNKSPELIAEIVLASLRELFDDFGVYTEELLVSGLLTLAHNKDSTLLHLPLLFNNPAFRKKMVSKLDEGQLKAYWRTFEAQSDNERRQQLAPLTRRLNILFMRKELIGALGQAQPKFNLEDVFNKNKILLVPLNSGITGKKISEMCANLLINLIWDIALKRAELPEDERKPVMLYVDEFQNYIKKSGADFEEILSMSRGLGIGGIYCAQNLSQISNDLKDSIFTNARSKIIFGTPNKRDAAQFADLTTSQLCKIDFMSLPQFSFYTTLNQKKIANAWISGKSFPPTVSKRLPLEVFAKSSEKYGRDLTEIEQEYIKLFKADTSDSQLENTNDIELLLGRKKRQG